MNEYPLMLYREGLAILWDGRQLDTLIVDDAEAHAAATADGWMTVAELVAPVAVKSKAKAA